MSVKAILSTLEYKIKEAEEEDIYRQYIAKLTRFITENSANCVTSLSGGQIEAYYVNIDYNDLINPKPVDNRSADEIIGNIKEKIKNMRE